VVANPIRPLLTSGILGLTMLVCALLAARHRLAPRIGIRTVGVLWVLAGAVVNP
jgi:hypothetical protein